MLSIGDSAKKAIGDIQPKIRIPRSQDLSKLADNYGGLGLSINLNNIYDFKRIQFWFKYFRIGNWKSNLQSMI